MVMPRVAGIKENIEVYGWIMNWIPFRPVGGDKMGEEITIKTVFKRRVGSENVSVYIGNVLIKSTKFLEKMREYKKPVLVHVLGKKRGEKVYTNQYIDGYDVSERIEHTRKILYVFLFDRDLKVKIVDNFPPGLLGKTGVIPPKMTFKKFHEVMNAKKRKLARAKHNTKPGN